MSETATLRVTPALRFVERVLTDRERFGSKVKILQQAWQVLETGAIEWRDVPFVVLEDENG